MKALDAYKDMLRELDKFESPTFTLRDFNFFYNAALSSYITKNYKQLDILQKDSDDLKSILKFSHPLTLSTGGLVTLPSDYRHLLGLKVKVKFKVDIGKYRKDQQIEFYPERMKSGQKGYRFKNSYAKPNYKRYYYEISGTQLQLLFDSNVVEIIDSAPNLWMDYVVQPAEVFLDPTDGADYNDVAKNTILFFNTGTVRNNIYFETLVECRRLVLENIESQRFPVAAQESLQS